MDGTATDYEFDNCLIRNNHTLIRYPDIGSHTLRLRNCTIYSVAEGYPRIALLGKEAKLTVEATGNVFHCQSLAQEVIEPKSISQVTWIGADNCFSGPWYQIWEEQPDKKILLKEKGLPAWNKLWKVPERGSREVDLLAFEWGRIQRLPNPERFHSVRAAIEEMIAKNKLSEVGPDWNLIGPGEAYVRALAAEGRAVPESKQRPERHEDGPIVLLRAGKEVRGYLTLKPALDDAQDQDIVELRTDGLVKDSHWTGDSRLLTIRAGAGYTPTINGNLISSGTDRLILEGLTIRYVLLASGGVRSAYFWNGEQPLFPTQGSVVRMLNCTLLGETNNSVADTWMFGDGASIPEIVNCVFGTLRIGLRSGGKARLRNSMFGDCRPNVESRIAQPGQLEIERCVFWLPEPAFNAWASSFHSRSSVQVQANHSIFVSPSDLTYGQPHPINWTGIGNVFMKPSRFQHETDTIELKQFQTLFLTEADSIELPPWEFDPAQWRILRDKSPGYQPRPDGTDYGADIDRLVLDLDRNTVHGPLDAPPPAIGPHQLAMTGTGPHLPLAPISASITPVGPSYVMSPHGFTGTWTATTPAAWRGTFTGIGLLPRGNSGSHSTKYEFSGLPRSVLAAGTYFALTDLDTVESLKLKAYDATHTVMSSPWLNLHPISQSGQGTGTGSPGQVLPTDMPGWKWDESTQTYLIEGTAIVGNPNITIFLSSRAAIGFLEVTREVTGFNFHLMAPAAAPVPSGLPVEIP